MQINKQELLRIIKSKTFFLILFCFTIVLTSCQNNSNKTDKQIVILAVNDIHSNLDAFPKFASLVDSLRVVYPDMVLVSAGDNQTGDPINDKFENKGFPVIDLMNRVGFDMTALGNHEFDYGIETLSEHINKLSEFEYLCANIKVPENLPHLNLKPYTFHNFKNGTKAVFLGIIQVSSSGKPDAHPDNVNEIEFLDPFKTALSYQNLKDSADVFIVLSHLGYEDDIKLANQFEHNKIDVIIGGHSHTVVEKNTLTNDILITHAGNSLKYATLVKINLNKNKVVSKEMELLTISQHTGIDTAINSKLDYYKQKSSLNKVIAYATDSFPDRVNIGYLMADANRILSKADIAIQNPGGVRINTLNKGEITLLDVYQADPFGNELVIFNFSGHELLKFLQIAYPRDHRPSIPSGVELKYQISPENELIKVEIFKNGKPLDLDKNYKVAVSSYQATAYKFDSKDAGKSTKKTTSDFLIEYLTQQKNIKSYLNENRLTIIE